MFSGNALENVGMYMREGVQRIGEDLMGTAIDHLLANQDQTLNQLGELQKYNLVKTVQRIVNSKFFPRERPVMPISDSVLLRALDDCLGDRKEGGRVVAEVTVQVGSVEAVSLPTLKGDSRSVRNSRWKVRARMGSALQESAISTVEASDKEGDYHATLRWPAPPVFVMGGLTDIQGDIQVEVWRKRGTDDGRIPDQGLADLTHFFGQGAGGQSNGQKAQPTDSDEEAGPDSGANEPGAPVDAAIRLRLANRSKRVHEWQLHGRVVIPVSSLLSTLALVEPASDKEGPVHLQRLGRPLLSKLDRTSARLQGWFHLYPKGQQVEEWKFVKPCVGYPGLGMLNPAASLGFVELTIDIKYTMNPLLAPLYTNMNPPEGVWTLASKFDLQAFENGGYRMHHIGGFAPRWIRRFFHVISIYKQWQSGGSAQHLTFALLFWIFTLYATLFAPLPLLPLLLGCGILIGSFSYKISPTDSLGTTLYVDPPPPEADPLRECPALYRSLHNIMRGRSSRSAHHISHWMNQSVLNLSTPRRPTGGRGYVLAGDDVPVTCVDASPTPQKRRRGSLVKLKQDSQVTPELENSNPPVASLLVPDVTLAPSSMGTIFGRADVCVRDATSYAPAYPIFSDDVGDVDMVLLKHMGLMVLEAVQLLATGMAMITEKVKFALDWTDPWSAVVTWVVVAVLSVQLTIAAYIFSALPSVLQRFFTLLLPTIIPLIATDPAFMTLSGASDWLDNFAWTAVQWQHESHVVLRFAQNVWDLLYLQHILTATERETRFTLVNKLMSSSIAAMDSPNLLTSPAGGSQMSSTTSPFLLASSDAPAMDEISSLLTEGIPRSHVGVVGSTTVVLPSRKRGSRRNSGVWRYVFFAVDQVWLNLIWGKVIRPIIVFELRFIYYWFLRLPDRREVEHRQIAATQWMGRDLNRAINYDRVRGDGEKLLSRGTDHSIYFQEAAKDLRNVVSSKSAATGTYFGAPPTPSPNGGRTSGLFMPRPFSFALESGEDASPAWYTAAGARRNVEAMRTNIIKSIKWDQDLRPANSDSAAEASPQVTQPLRPELNASISVDLDDDKGSSERRSAARPRSASCGRESRSPTRATLRAGSTCRLIDGGSSWLAPPAADGALEVKTEEVGPTRNSRSVVPDFWPPKAWKKLLQQHQH